MEEESRETFEEIRGWRRFGKVGAMNGKRRVWKKETF
jgi:hypothetical protein